MPCFDLRAYSELVRTPKQCPLSLWERVRVRVKQCSCKIAPELLPVGKHGIDSTSSAVFLFTFPKWTVFCCSPRVRVIRYAPVFNLAKLAIAFLSVLTVTMTLSQSERRASRRSCNNARTSEEEREGFIGTSL